MVVCALTQLFSQIRTQQVLTTLLPRFGGMAVRGTVLSSQAERTERPTARRLGTHEVVIAVARLALCRSGSLALALALALGFAAGIWAEIESAVEIKVFVGEQRGAVDLWLALAFRHVVCGQASTEKTNSQKGTRSWQET